MPTRNVVLTEHHEEIIDRLVKSGCYQNASEVMREGLRMIEQREIRETIKLRALREAAATGFADLDKGRFTDVPGDKLEDYIGRISREAGSQMRKVDP